jgi:hypothetical protein
MENEGGFERNLGTERKMKQIWKVRPEFKTKWKMKHSLIIKNFIRKEQNRKWKVIWNLKKHSGKWNTTL